MALADAREYRALAGRQRPPQSRDWRLGLRGAGPVRIGMTLAEASRAADGEVHDEARDWSCADWSPVAADRVPGVPVFAIRDGVIAYATLVTPDGRTRSGARVGMSETALRRLYGSRLEVSPSPRGHPGEQWLVYAPRFAADSAYRMVFETDGVNVGAIIAGRWPFDRVVEGCAP